MNLIERISRNLEEINKKGLRRELAAPKGIDLSSNDFLCLSKDKRIVSAFINGLKREGVGSTASRLLRGERDSFRKVEANFAEWKNTEKSLYFATGYQANIGVLQTFLEPEDVVFSDELNHASLIDGMRLSKCRKIVFRHLGFDQLAKLLRETKCEGQKFLVTESLFSMDGDIAPLNKYAKICRATNTNLIVDEAHAIGVFGARGSGLIEEFGISNDVLLSINTAGKALGVSGAFVAGSDLAIEYLINKCRSFIFSTAPVPAIADALIESLSIVEREKQRRERLLQLSRFFRDLLNENGVKLRLGNSQIIPIMIGDSKMAVRIADAMQFDGFDVRAIRPPTVADGTSRLRISLNTGLSEEILNHFVGKLKLLL